MSICHKINGKGIRSYFERCVKVLVHYWLSDIFSKLHKFKSSEYHHAQDMVYVSKYSKDAIFILVNTGTFSSRYFRDDEFIDNIRMALDAGTKLTYVFGPGICIYAKKFFRLLENYLEDGHVKLLYRTDFDKEDWDQKHFNYAEYDDGYCGVRIERSHDEFAPDSAKNFVIHRAPKGQTGYFTRIYNEDIINKYFRKFKQFENEKEYKIVVNIKSIGCLIKEAEKFKDEPKVVRNNKLRLRGFIDSNGNDGEDVKPATSDQIDNFSECFLTRH